MREVSRRAFNQLISGTVASLAIVNAELRGEQPPKGPRLNLATIAGHGEGFDSKNRFKKSNSYIKANFDPTVNLCTDVLAELTKQATMELVAQGYDEVYFIIEYSDCPMVDPHPETEEKILSQGSKPCFRDRWIAYVKCDTCGGFPITGLAQGLTRIGALAKANRDLEERLCKAKTRCAKKKTRRLRRLQPATCCD